MSMVAEKLQHGAHRAEQRRGRKRMRDEKTANEADLSPRKTFKTQTYLVMIDSLLAELEKRMKTYDDTSKTLRFLSELTSLNIKQIDDSRFLVSRWKTH